MINVEEFFTAIEQLHGYKDNGKEYIFYYDETNNYRKVKITEKGLNDFKVMFDNFTLGGICFEKSKERDNKELIKNLKLSKQALPALFLKQHPFSQLPYSGL